MMMMNHVTKQNLSQTGLVFFPVTGFESSRSLFGFDRRGNSQHERAPTGCGSYQPEPQSNILQNLCHKELRLLYCYVLRGKGGPTLYQHSVLNRGTE